MTEEKALKAVFQQNIMNAKQIMQGGKTQMTELEQTAHEATVIPVSLLNSLENQLTCPYYDDCQFRLQHGLGYEFAECQNYGEFCKERARIDEDEGN